MEFVIIGDGIAGATAAETLRKEDEEASIKIFTDESEPLYNRIMLKTFMKGTLPVQYTKMHDQAWYEKRDIDLFLETKISEIKSEDNTVISEDGEEYSYDKLLLATGGSPREFPLDKGFENLHYMWTMKDAETIKKSAENSEEAVVIGGGLLGIDLAVAYAENNCETHYLIRDDNWWHRGLTKKGAEIIHRKLREKGVNIITNVEAVNFEAESDKITSVETDNGEFYSCDTVAVAIGQNPNSDIVDVKKDDSDCVMTDMFLQTSDNDIYAAGNLVNYHSPVLGKRAKKGSWDHSEAMGACAAENMLAYDEPFEFVNTYGVGHFDVQFLAIGDWTGDGVEIKYSEDEYRRLFFNDDKLVGAVMIGFTKGQEKIKKLIKSGNCFEDKQPLLEKEFWD